MNGNEDQLQFPQGGMSKLLKRCTTTLCLSNAKLAKLMGISRSQLTMSFGGTRKLSTKAIVRATALAKRLQALHVDDRVVVSNEKLRTKYIEMVASLRKRIKTLHQQRALLQAQLSTAQHQYQALVRQHLLLTELIDEVDCEANHSLFDRGCILAMQLVLNDCQKALHKYSPLKQSLLQGKLAATNGELATLRTALRQTKALLKTVQKAPK